MQVFQIWIEGFAATGDRGYAQKVGTGIGETFKDAVLDWASKQRHLERDWGRLDEERLSLWGCRLFDNEVDARRSFG